MRMKKLAAVLSAAAMAVSAISVNAFAAAPSTVPVGYGDVKMAIVDEANKIYGATISETDLKKVVFSPKNDSIGRNADGYWCGFYLEANDTSKSGTATYETKFTYVADTTADTIKGLSYSAGSSTDGQFWANFRYDYLAMGMESGAAGKAGKSILLYSVKLTNGSDVSYNYIAVDCGSLNDDFAFTEKCGVSGADHDSETPCTCCGNKKAAPVAPEFNLSNTAKEETSKKNEYPKADGKTHFNYQYNYPIFDNASFDSVMAITDTDVKVNLISTDPTAPAGAEELNLYLALDNTEKGGKWSQLMTTGKVKCGESTTIKVKASDIELALTGKSAQLTKDDKISLYLVFATAEDVEFTTVPKLKFAFGEYKAPAEETTTPAETEAPSGGNNPGYVVITPNDTTAADTTAAAPEVVTGANGESVEAPKDVIPDGAVLEVKEQSKEEAVKAVEAVKTTDDNKDVVETVKKSVEDGKAAVLDINLVKDGVKVQPDGTIKVTINIPEILKNAAQLFVYRVEDNGTFTDVKATVSGGKLVFSTGHFSTYIITSEALTGNAVVTEATTAAPAETTAATTANGSTSTEDKNQATGVVLAVIPAILAAAGVVTAKKRK